ncbi:MAG: alpha/beta fold hydrolase [Acidimicrobiales bacterium]
MPFCAIDGLDVYYERHGAGPPLLNIGGSGGDLRTSRPERSPLNKAFEVVHYDQRGLGRTAKPDGPYTMADYADDAAALIAAVGWERAHVVGTSFGGMVAQHLAIRHPERIDRLAIACTSPGGGLPSAPLHELEGVDPTEALHTKLGWLDARYDPRADDPLPGLRVVYDALVAGTGAPRDPEEARGSRLQLLARAAHDATDRLGEIRAPTLVCAGRYDNQAPLVNSEALVAGIPDAELRVFEGGHLFLLQDRSAFPAIIGFLQAR